MQPSGNSGVCETWLDLFTVGAQCGLLPNQVLDMSLPQLKAVIDGYQDHLFDLKCLAVIAGHWAGYFGNTKKPKSLKVILKDLLDSHIKSKKKHSNSSIPKPEVDVEEFLRREEQFNRRFKGR